MLKSFCNTSSLTGISMIVQSMVSAPASQAQCYENLCAGNVALYRYMKTGYVGTVESIDSTGLTQLKFEDGQKETLPRRDLVKLTPCSAAVCKDTQIPTRLQGRFEILGVIPNQKIIVREVESKEISEVEKLGDFWRKQK